jgi:predicted dehydrogenase
MTRRHTPPTRRSFIQGAAAAAGVGFFALNGRTYAAESKSPNEKLNIAWVGVGGKGSSDCDHAGEVGQVVAICDVDESTLANKGEKFGDAETFVDFREMIDKLGDKVDAVGVSTPDHTHYAAAMMAMKAGKHVYCQKPLTYSVWEARQLREIAAKKNLKTQMGNQGSASDGLRRESSGSRRG